MKRRRATAFAWVFVLVLVVAAGTGSASVGARFEDRPAPHDEARLRGLCSRRFASCGAAGGHERGRRQPLALELAAVGRPRPRPLLPQRLLPADGVARRHADDRDRRRLRRPEHRVRPRGVRPAVRPAAVHHRQRLLPEGRPDGGTQLPGRGPAGISRSRSTSRSRTRSARTARSCSSRPPRTRLANLGTAVNRRRRDGRERRLQLLRRGRVLGRDDPRERLLQASRRGDHRLPPATAATASSSRAASQYVTAVGGTTLSLNAGQELQERGRLERQRLGLLAVRAEARLADGRGAARSARSRTSPRTPTRTAARRSSTPSAPGNGQGAWYQVGGTSLAAPLIGAVYALTGNTNSRLRLHAVRPARAPERRPLRQQRHLHAGVLCTGRPRVRRADGPRAPRTGARCLRRQASPAPEDDFALSVSPASRTVTQGSPAGLSGHDHARERLRRARSRLGTTGLPNGASGASFSPNPATSGSTLTVTTTAEPGSGGTYPFTITGTSGSLRPLGVGDAGRPGRGGDARLRARGSRRRAGR